MSHIDTQSLASTKVAASLIDVYRESHYHIAGEQPMVLLLDTYSADLAAVHQRAGVTNSVFMTACNPRSVPLDGIANAHRQDLLAHALRVRNIAFIDGWGAHPTNGWPLEPSFLALGLPLGDAQALGRDFDQNAILYADQGAVMRLVLLR